MNGEHPRHISHDEALTLVTEEFPDPIWIHYPSRGIVHVYAWEGGSPSQICSGTLDSVVRDLMGEDIGPITPS